MTKLNVFLVLILTVLSITVVAGFVYLQNDINILKDKITILEDKTRTESNPFIVTGYQQSAKSVNGQYNVVSWNFTFKYIGEKSIQNVNFFLGNDTSPFLTEPEITTDWVYTYMWTPEDLSASRTVTISWQGGVQTSEFQP
jgi:hypothetical protein